MYTMLQRCEGYEYITSLFVNCNAGKQVTSNLDRETASCLLIFMRQPQIYLMITIQLLA